MISLKNRIYLQNVIIIISLVMILEFIFILFLNNYYNEGVKRELQSKLTLSATLYNKYLVRESMEERISYILESESKNEAFYVELIDNDFNLLIDSNGFNNKANTFKYKDLILASKASPDIVKYEGNETIIAMTMPLYDKDSKVWGYLRYSTCIDKVKRTLNNIIQLSIIIISLVIIITFFLSSILANKILDPIETLINASKKMANGDFSQDIVIKNKDEIGILGETLNYMSKEIMKSNKLKNEFISSISHELRTPLTAIKGWSELILTGDVEDLNDIKEGMSIISNETDRLTILVEDLLDFSKLESGKIKMNMESVNLKELIKDISYYFKNTIEEKDLSLKLNLCKEDIIVLGDKNRLKQVFINLLHNAIKFTEEGKNIYTSLKIIENSKALISIKDEGIGISEKDLPKVTEKFYKGNSKYSGSGIGLAICKEILTLHNAELHIESEEHIGTTIILAFNILTNL